MPYLNGKFVSYEEYTASKNNTSTLAPLTDPTKPGKTLSELGGFGAFKPQTKDFQGGFFQDYQPGLFGIDTYVPEGLNEYSDFEQLRAEQQSAGTQWAFGASKFLTTTASTIADNTLGTIAGLGNMISEGSERGYLTAFIDNPVSNALNGWNEAMEKIAPNYKTKYEEENTDLTSANFWADTVLKNAGFAVGSILPAMLTGGASMAAMTKLGKKQMINQLKQAGKLSDELIDGIARGTITAANLGDEILKASKTYNRFKTASQVIGSTFGSLGEARLEAIDARKSTEKYLQSSGLWDTMTDEARNNALDAAGNSVFVTNMALLSLSNYTQFRSLFSRGFGFNKARLNVVGNLQEGYKRANKNAIIYGGKLIKNPLTEGFEEGSQYILQGAGSDYAVSRINDPDANFSLYKYWGAVKDSIAKASQGNKEFTESVLSGAILGFTGIPGIKGGNIVSRIKEGKQEIAASDSFLDNIGKNKVAQDYKELATNISELKGLLSQEEDPTDEKAQRIQQLKNGILTSISLLGDMQKSLEKGDKQSYISFENQEFANLVFTMIEADQFSELKQSLKDSLNISPEELRELYSDELTTKTKEGEQTQTFDHSKYKTAEDLLTEHKERINEKIANLERVSKIYNSIQIQGNGKLGTEAVRNLSIAMYNAEQLDKRQKELAADLNRYLQVNPNLINMDLGREFSEFFDYPKVATDEQVKDTEKVFGSKSDRIAAAQFQGNIQDLVDDLNNPDTKIRNKAAEKLENILAAKSIEEVLAINPTEKTVTELAGMVKDLNTISGEKRILGTHIRKAFQDPANYNENINKIVKKGSLNQDFLADSFPIYAEIKKARLTIDAVQEYVKTMVANKQLEDLQNNQSTKKNQEGVPVIETSDEADLTPFEDWTTFLRTTGSQENIEPNTPQFYWFKFLAMYIKQIATDKVKMYAITIDNIPDSLKTRIQFYSEDSGYKYLSEITEEEKDSYRQDIKLIPLLNQKDKKYEFIEIDGNIPTSSLPIPSLIRTSGVFAGQSIFSYKKWIEQNPDKNLKEAQDEAVKLYSEWRAAAIEQAKTTKVLPLHVISINPGARDKSAEVSNLTDTIQEPKESVEDFIKRVDPEIIVVTSTDPNEKFLTREIDGNVFRLAVGASYIIHEGVPYLIQEELLSDATVNNTVEVLKWLARNPSKDNTLQMVGYLASYMNMYTKDNSPFKLYVTSDANGNFQSIVFGNNRLSVADLISGNKVDAFKDFLKTKRYNVSNTNLGKKFVAYIPVDGQMTQKSFKSYNEFMLTNNKIKLKMKKFPRTSTGEIDYDKMTLSPSRLNRSLQLTTKAPKTSTQPKSKSTKSKSTKPKATKEATQPTETNKKEVVVETMNLVDIPEVTIPEITVETMDLTGLTPEEMSNGIIDDSWIANLKAAENKPTSDKDTAKSLYKEIKSGNGRPITDWTVEEQKIWDKYNSQEFRDSVDQEILLDLSSNKTTPETSSDPFTGLDFNTDEENPLSLVTSVPIPKAEEKINLGLQAVENIEVVIDNKIEEENEKIKEVAKEENITEIETKKVVKKTVKEILNGIVPKINISSKLYKLSKKIAKTISVGILSLFIYSGIVAYSPSDNTYSINNIVETSTSVLSDEYQQSAIRQFAKMGIYDPTEFEQTVELSSIKETPQVDINITNDSLYRKQNTFTELIGKVKDSHYKARPGKEDSLIMIRNQFMNDNGFTYIPGAIKSRTLVGDKYSNSLGVAHFMVLDDNGVDLTSRTTEAELQKASNQFKQNRIGKDIKLTDYVPVFSKNDNRVTLKYKLASEVNEKDITITRLHQYKFGEINFNAKVDGKKFGFSSGSVFGLETKTGKAIPSLLYTGAGKNAYSRFSGGSVVFIFKDQKGNIVVRDFTGSINMIEKEGNAIANTYKVDINDITIGIYDAGSYSAKPASKNGTLFADQYSGYNILHPNSAGALIIPTTSNKQKNPFRLQTESTSEITEQEDNWFSNAFKNAVITPVVGLIDDVAIGQMVSGVNILISNLAGSGIKFHEGFHLIENHVPKEAKAAYNALRKRLGNKVVTVQSGKTFVSKPGKDLTDSEASEFLAYDFEMFMLDPDNYNFPSKEEKGLFDKIYDFISKFLEYFGLNIRESSIEDLFEFAKNSKNLELSEKITNKTRENIYSIGNYKEGYSNVLLQDFNVSFFKHLFYKDDLSLDVDKLYRYANLSKQDKANVYKYLGAQLQKEFSTADNNRKRIIAAMIKDQTNPDPATQKIVWNELVNQHIKLLSSYGISDLEQDTEDLDDITLSTTQNDNSWDSGNTTDYRSKTPASVRLLLASLPKTTMQDSQRKYLRFGDYAQMSNVEYDSLINLLHARLAGSSSLQEMVSRMETLAKKPKFDYLNIIINALNLKEGVTDNPSLLKLRLDFEQHFKKKMHNIININLGENSVEVLNAISDSQEFRLRNSWRDIASMSSDNGIIAYSEETGLYINKSAVNAWKAESNEDRKVHLELLGIKLPEEVTDIAEQYSNLVKEITGSKSDKPLLDWFYSTENKSLGRIRELATKAAKFTEEENYLQFQNAEGKTEYAIALPTFLDIITRSINNKTIPDHLKPFDGNTGNPLTLFSSWIAEAQDPKSKFEILSTILKGVQDKEGGVDFSKANQADLLVGTIAGLTEGLSGFPRAADRTVEYGIKTPMVEYANPSAIAFADEYLEKFTGYLKGELLATVLYHTRGWGKGFKNWDRQVNQFGVFDYMPESLMDNLVKGISTDPKIVGEELAYVNEYFENNKKEFEKYLMEDFRDSVSNLQKTLVANRVLDRNLDKEGKFNGTYTINGLPLFRVKELLGKKEEIDPSKFSLADLNTLSTMLTFHDMVSKQEMVINILGDVRNYKNPDQVFKRTGLPTATRYESILDNNTNRSLDKVYPRKDGKARSNKLTKLIVKDVETPSKSSKLLEKILGKNSPYSGKMNVADAQGWLTPDAWLELHLRSYNQYVTENTLATVEYVQQLYYYRLYQKTLATPEKADVEFAEVTWDMFKDMFSKHLPDDVTPENFVPSYLDSKGNKVKLTDDIVQKHLVNLAVAKPQGVGAASNTGGLFINQTDKLSAPMLSHLDFAENSPMMKVLDWAILNQLDLIEFESGSKTDYIKHEVFTADGINIPDSKIITETSWEHFGIQQPMESKSKDKIIFSSQARSMTGMNFNHPLYPEYKKVIDLQIKKAQNKLISELGLDQNVSNEKLTEALTRAFETKDITIDQLEGIALALSEGSSGKFDLLKDKPKLENILTSFFKNNIIHKKVYGDNLVQVSSIGIGYDLKFYSIEGYDENKDNYEQVKNNKTTAAEAIIPLPQSWWTWVIENFGSLEEFNNQLHTTKLIDQRILTISANRIPCQGPNLIDVFKIKRFSHPVLGSKIYLPLEHTTKTGSDFDVDKLLSYFNNSYFMDGTIKMTEFIPDKSDKSFEAWKDQNASKFISNFKSDAYLKGYATRLNNISDTVARFDKEASTKLKDWFFDFITDYTGSEPKDIKSGIQALMELKKTKAERIAEINAYLAGDYVENTDEENLRQKGKKFLPDFKEREVERKTLIDEIRELSSGLDTIINTLSAIKSERLELLETENPVLRSINTRKDNILRENFNNLELQEINTEAQIENELNRIMIELTLSAENRFQLLNTTDKVAEDLKDSVDNLKPAGSENDDKVKFSYANKMLFSLKKAGENFVALSGVGLTAVAGVSHAITQKSPVKINKRMKLFFSGFDQGMNNYKIGVEKSTDDKFVSDSFNAFMTYYVDAPNNPGVFKTNVYDDMFTVYNFLKRTTNTDKTLSDKYLLAFFRQPIIKEFISRMGSNKSKFYKVNGFKQDETSVAFELLEEIGYKGIIKTDKSFSLLKSYWSNPETTNEDIDSLAIPVLTYNQLMTEITKPIDKADPQIIGMVLDFMLLYKDFSQNLNKLEKITRPQSSFAKNRAGLKVIEVAKEDLIKDGFFDAADVDKLLRNTLLNEFDKTSALASEKLSPFFLTDIPAIRDKFKQKISYLLNSYYSMTDTEISVDKLENYLVNYIIQNFSSGTNLTSEAGRLLLPTLNDQKNTDNIAEQIKRAKEDPELANNPLIEVLYPQMMKYIRSTRKKSKIASVSFLNRKYSVDKLENINAGLKELYDSNNPDHVELAKDIVKFSIISTGLQYTPESIQPAIVNKIYFDLVKESIDNFIDQSSRPEFDFDKLMSNFEKVIAQNRPTDEDIIPLKSHYTKKKNLRMIFDVKSISKKIKAVDNLTHLSEEFKQERRQKWSEINLELEKMYGSDYKAITFSKTTNAPYVGMIYIHTKEVQIGAGFYDTIKTGEKTPWLLEKTIFVDPEYDAPIYVRVGTKGELNRFLEMTAPEIDSIIKENNINKKNVVQEVVSANNNTLNIYDTLNIYAGTNENADLSNFAIRPFSFKNQDFDSVEQAFQYAKIAHTPASESSFNNNIAQQILDSKSSAYIKYLGKQFKGLNTRTWDEVSSQRMKDLIKASFEQNPSALQKLLATGNTTLTHTQDKTKWGTEFPKLLMEVRKELSLKWSNNSAKIQSGNTISKVYTKNNKSIDTDFALTSGQKNALDKLIDFSNSKEKAITLQGPAGTGKTAVIGYLQKYLGNSTNIVYMAPTHAATAELAFATIKTGNKSLPMTIASAFRYAFDPDTKQKVAGMSKKLSDKIKFSNNIIVVDEVSMLANKDLKLVMEAINKRDNIKIIYMGDILQIPEVDPTNPSKKQVSKAFSDFEQLYLTEVKRTDSVAILNVLENLRSNINSLIPKVEDTANIIYADDNVFDKLVSDKFVSDPENSVLISYTNSGVRSFNTKVRNLFGQTDELEKGDVIVGYLGYSSKQIEKESISNSIRYKVTNVEKRGSRYLISADSQKLEQLEKQGVKNVKKTGYSEYLPLSENDSFVFEDSTKEEKLANNKYLSELFKKLYEAKKEALKNPRAWIAFYAAQEKIANVFANIDLGNTYVYNPETDQMELFNSMAHKNIFPELKVEKGIDFGYAITVHKSQGSTIKNVFYDTSTLPQGEGTKLYNNEDLVGNEKHSLNYVGMSRASELLVVKNTRPDLFYKITEVSGNTWGSLKDKIQSKFPDFTEARKIDPDITLEIWNTMNEEEKKILIWQNKHCNG